ncbi:RNA-binding protein 4 [Striga asiatica]|uniref:RNA-binding protein 4 n=1 Tax=Striga asiatica TaxID=4170 RepID=A0A5A7PXN3_STRAF|nr:RNA-binding protein 4 [Striga asiatica]
MSSQLSRGPKRTNRQAGPSTSGPKRFKKKKRSAKKARKTPMPAVASATGPFGVMKPKGKCHRCGKSEHWKTNCPKKGKKGFLENQTAQGRRDYHLHSTRAPDHRRPPNTTATRRPKFTEDVLTRPALSQHPNDATSRLLATQPAATCDNPAPRPVTRSSDVVHPRGSRDQLDAQTTRDVFLDANRNPPALNRTQATREVSTRPSPTAQRTLWFTRFPKTEFYKRLFDHHHSWRGDNRPSPSPSPPPLHEVAAIGAPLETRTMSHTRRLDRDTFTDNIRPTATHTRTPQAAPDRDTHKGQHSRDPAIPTHATRQDSDDLHQ